MSVAPSAQFGPYRIVEHVASGGIGEVYKAVDTRLDRTVALKTLSKNLSTDPLARQRFEREARIISSLNHPYICSVYDVGEQDGIEFLVMEFVKGNPLSHDLAKGPLPFGKALQYAMQVAEALHEAHRNSVVHRDLKPGNIMITPAGAKLLDFGLAKSVEPVSEQTRTIAPETGSGTILGTIAYMSPEQAEGKPADARSDIFSFASVLYEMVTGRRAFTGGSQISVLSSILRDQPARATQINHELPAELDRILGRCWRKDPDQRFQSIADVKHALEDLSEPQPQTLQQIPIAAKKWIWIPWALAALATTIALLVTLRTERPEDVTYKLTQMTADGGLAGAPALSPDSKLIAFASDRAGGGNLDIWVRQTNSAQLIRLTDDLADDTTPAFSPDGSTVAFRSERDGGGIYLVPALGGEARLLAKGGYDPQFSPDGKYIAMANGTPSSFAVTARISIVPVAGGEPRTVGDTVHSLSHPRWLTSSKLIAFARPGQSAFRFLVCDLPACAWTNAEFGDKIPDSAQLGSIQVNTQGTNVVFASGMGSGARGLWSMGIDPTSARATGEPKRLTFGSAVETDPSPSDTGAIAFASVSSSLGLWQMPIDSNANPEKLDSDVLPKFYPAISRDGRYIAYSSIRNGTMQVCVRELASGQERVLTSGTGRFNWPVFHGDGRIAYADNVPRRGNSIFSISLRGGLPETICTNCFRLDDLSSDSRYILDHGAGKGLIEVYDRKTSTRSVYLSPPAKSELFQPHFSPDNRWVTFIVKTAPTESQIFAAPFREGASVPQSDWIPLTDGVGGDDKPRLSNNGRTLYFTSSRDGYRCIYFRQMDASMHPSGQITAFKHLHSARRSMGAVALGNQEIAVSQDRMIFNLADLTGEIWMLTPEKPATR